MEDPFLGNATLVASRLATERFRYPEVAPYCIYCGSCEDRGREHIYPAGLLGKLELLMASCSSCSKVTGTLEQSLLRGQFWLARRRAGIQSGRDKRGQPDTFPIVHNLPDGDRTIEVPLEAAPAFGLLLCLPWPSAMPGPVPDRADRQSLKRFFAFSFDETGHIMDEVDRANARGPITIGQPTPRHAIARFVAKVCHSFAVAELGIDRFRPYLFNIIMKGENDEYREFIGQYPETLGEKRGQLSVYTLTQGPATIVLVRANLWPAGIPPYLAVVGELWR